MKYLNQLHYPHIPYPTNLDDPNDHRWHQGSVKDAGCGLCSACMIVDQLLTKPFSLRDCLALSVSTGANRGFGTNMRILGPAVAERFDLDYKQSDDIRTAIEALRDGARIIVNVGGDREGYRGVFCDVGHYMVVISGNDRELCLLDPMWDRRRYTALAQQGKVRMAGKFVCCAPEVLDQDASNRSPRYHIFRRR